MLTENSQKYIETELRKMRHADWRFKKFGSKSHRYRPNNKLVEKDILDFESKYSIRLPEDYRWYIANVGNGGAGPGYGLQTLQNSLLSFLDNPEQSTFLDPSNPFTITRERNPFLKRDNPDFELFKDSESYQSDEWMNGVLRLSTYGCGIYINLVVNGEEFGNLWVDDRIGDNGVYPYNASGSVSFGNWYARWLEDVTTSTSVPRWMFWF